MEEFHFADFLLFSLLQALFWTLSKSLNLKKTLQVFVLLEEINPALYITDSFLIHQICHYVPKATNEANKTAHKGSKSDILNIFSG